MPVPHYTSRARRAGFTLLEVMLALLILGVSMVAIATVMHTGVRAWSVGHATSELFQTARIAQDVILRDLDNMVFETEADYNGPFRAQMNKAVQDALNGIEPNLKAISPPIDLSFRGQDRAKTDQLSFVRSYRPRFPGDPVTLGLRRVSFYVRKGVLYRKEEDPYGVPSRRGLDQVGPPTNNRQHTMRQDGNQNMVQLASYTPGNWDPAMRDETSYNTDDLSDKEIMRRQLEDLYRRPDDTNTSQDGDPAGDQENSDAPDSGYLPTQVRLEEPICTGVEIFNITYGYFKDGKWEEVPSWDSRDQHYRIPFSEDEIERIMGIQQGMNAQMVQNMIMPKNPDDLPGYVAIQLGVRVPAELGKSKGRMRSFTIYHSMPLAKETDVLVTDDTPLGGAGRTIR